MRTGPTRIERNRGFYKKGPIERRQLTSNKKLYSHFIFFFFFKFVLYIFILSKFYLFTNWCTSELS